MKMKHAERSLTGLLVAWLLLMAVWLVPGSAWARIAPSGREATPALGAYEAPAEASMEMRGVSTVALGEGEESVAEGQRAGVPAGAGALRPAYTAERTSPAVSARAVKPRAPSGGDGTLKFILDPATQAAQNMRGLTLLAKSVMGMNANPKDTWPTPIKDGEKFPKNVGHFAVGYSIGEPSKDNYFLLKTESDAGNVFKLGSVEFEITVVANDELAQRQNYLIPKPHTVWKRNFKPNSYEGDDVNVYIHEISSKIPLQIKHYVDGREMSAPPAGWKLMYDQVREIGWGTDGMKVPQGAKLQYSWTPDGVQIDGVRRLPKQIKINGQAVNPIPVASAAGEWKVPADAGGVTIEVYWEKDVRKITCTVNDVNRQSRTELKLNGKVIDSGSSIDGKITKVGLEAHAKLGFTAFAVSVNGILTRLRESGNGSLLIDDVSLPAGGEDANIVVYYVPYDERGDYYTVSVDPSITNGTVTVNPPVAKVHDTIKLTITPDLGFACNGVTVTWKVLGMGDYTPFPIPSFKMIEASDVTVTATFEEFPGVVFTVNGGATVTINGNGGSYTATAGASDTQVTVPNVPLPTEGKVTVTSGGHTVEVPVKVDAGGVATPSDLTLHPVTVTVVEQGTTTGIANATVTAGGQTSAKTGGDGVATLYLVREVTYSDLGATAMGYNGISGQTLTVNGGGLATPDKIELAKAGTHSVAFTVSPGATVTVKDGSNVTHTAQDADNDGSVTVPGVPEITTGGTVTVASGGHTVEVPVKVDEHGVATPRDLTLHAVTVTVVEQGTTTGIANATVTVGGQSVTADTDGVATLHLVKGVTYSDLGAAATGYTAISGQTLTVDGGGHATPDKIELTKAGQSDPYLHVFVVDENLRAIDGVSVSVNVSGEEPRVTDRAGHAAWQLKADGKYELTLKKDGYVMVTTSVKLDVRGHDLTVVMQRVAQADPKKEDPKGHVTAVESELLAGASLYPNPAREYTTLQGIEHAEMVSILTLSGVEVQRLAVPGEREHKLDVSSLAEGIYLVVLETRGGERRTLKLVVRR